MMLSIYCVLMRLLILISSLDNVLLIKFIMILFLYCVFMKGDYCNFVSVLCVYEGAFHDFVSA